MDIKFYGHGHFQIYSQQQKLKKNNFLSTSCNNWKTNYFKQNILNKSTYVHVLGLFILFYDTL